MNKRYRILSFILIIGYGFFFTTRWWNIDDRPRFNSWATQTIGNNQGRIAITEVVYVTPLDALDIIIEQTAFTAHRDHEFVLEVVVHLLDGTSEATPFVVMDEATHMNTTRQLWRVYLSDHQLDWHYVELALIDEERGTRSRLTMDWRLVGRTDELKTAESYDLSFDVLVTQTQPNMPTFHEQQPDMHHHDHGDLGHSHAPDLSFEGLHHSLDIAFTQYALVSELLEAEPDNDILVQSLAFYESEIERIQHLIEEHHDDRD